MLARIYTSVDSHFMQWIWNKIQRAVDPATFRRQFDCGKSDVPPVLPLQMDTPRVTGGMSAVDHSYPWMVNVLNVKSLKSCGGAIIAPDTILTGMNIHDLEIALHDHSTRSSAAHCIIDEPKYISVIAGAATLIGRLNLFNYYAVSHVIVHPQYVSCCDYDLAIIKLKKRLERSNMINSICLPSEQNQVLPPDSIALITGWGGKYPAGEMNAFGSFHLKQGVVYVKSNDYCKHIYGSYDEHDEICATNERDSVDSRGNYHSMLTVDSLTDISLSLSL
jgi:hypothetical protein